MGSSRTFPSFDYVRMYKYGIAYVIEPVDSVEDVQFLRIKPLYMAKDKVLVNRTAR